MTNEVEYKPKSYAANGVTIDFPFYWKVLDEEDITVTLVNIATGVATPQTLGRDYNVYLESAGGYVQFIVTHEAVGQQKTPPPLGCNVVLSRNTPQYQSSTYSTSPGFQGSEIEKSFDKVSLNLQEMEYSNQKFREDFTAEIKSDLDRCLKVPVGSSETPEELMEHLLSAEETTRQYKEQAKQYSESAGNSADTATEQAEIATAKTQEVVEAHETAMSDIATAKQDALDDIEEKRTDALADIETARAGAVSEINGLHTEYVSDMESVGDSILSDIESTRAGAVQDVTDAHTTAMNELNTTMESVTTLKNQTLSTVSRASTEAIQAVRNEVQSSVTEIANAKEEALQGLDGAVEVVNTARDEALSAIDDAEAEAVENVATSKEDAVEYVSEQIANTSGSALDIANRAVELASGAMVGAYWYEFKVQDFEAVQDSDFYVCTVPNMPSVSGVYKKKNNLKSLAFGVNVEINSETKTAYIYTKTKFDGYVLGSAKLVSGSSSSGGGDDSELTQEEIDSMTISDWDDIDEDDN